MKRLASPQDLQAELHRLLAYAQSPRPSRERLSTELTRLADEVAGDTTIYYGNDVEGGMVVQTAFALPLPLDPRKFAQRMGFGIWKVTGIDERNVKSYRVDPSPSKSGYAVLVIDWAGHVDEPAVEKAVDMFLKKEGRKAGYRWPPKKLPSADAARGV